MYYRKPLEFMDNVGHLCVNQMHCGGYILRTILACKSKHL